jgi:hypothetical protein
MFVGSSRQSHQFARPFQPYRRIRVAQVVLTVLRRRAARHEIIPARRASQPVFRLLTFQLPTAFANSRRIDDPNRIVVPSDPPGAENEGSSPSATTRPTPGRNFFAMCTSNFIQLKASQNQHIRKNTEGGRPIRRDRPSCGRPSFNSRLPTTNCRLSTTNSPSPTSPESALPFLLDLILSRINTCQKSEEGVGDY